MPPTYYNPMGSYSQYGFGPNPGTPQMNPFDALAQSYQQQRQNLMQSMPQALPQMPQQQTQQQFPPQIPLTARLATNIDEVRATPIDLISTNLFYNQAANEIYLSKIDDMGAKSIRTYIPADAQQLPASEDQNETPPEIKHEFNERFDRMTERLDRIENLLQPLSKLKDKEDE